MTGVHQRGISCTALPVITAPEFNCRKNGNTEITLITLGQAFLQVFIYLSFFYSLFFYLCFDLFAIIHTSFKIFYGTFLPITLRSFFPKCLLDLYRKTKKSAILAKNSLKAIGFPRKQMSKSKVDRTRLKK